MRRYAIRAKRRLNERESYEPKLAHLPGTKLKPQVTLQRTLDKLPRIKAAEEFHLEARHGRQPS